MKLPCQIKDTYIHIAALQAMRQISKLSEEYLRNCSLSAYIGQTDTTR